MPKLPTDYRELQQLAKDLGLPANGSAEELAAAIVEHSEENPALEPYAQPDPPEFIDPGQAIVLDTDPKARTYRVVGEHHEVHGAKHGETFTAFLPAGQEAALVEGGHIEIVEGQPSENTTQEG